MSALRAEPMMTNEREKKEIRFWHPLLHQRFGENLHYYLVTIVGYKSTTLSVIKEELRRLGIVGFCLYEIYGPFDLLLRVWLSQETKTKLEEWLKEAAYIRNHAVFQVSWQRHFSGLNSETKDHSVVEQVQNVDTSLVLRALEEEPQAIESLERAGLTTLLRDASSSDRIKFYTLVIPTGVTDSEKNAYVQTRLVTALDDAHKEKIISEPSVYTGFGTAAWAMLKGRFQPDDYYRFGSLILTLGAELSVFQFRLFTLFIANWNSSESDSIAVSLVRATKVAASIDPEIYAWLPEFYAAQLDDPKRNGLRSLLVAQYYFKMPQYESDDRLLIRNLLIAGMFNQEDEYIRLLAGWFIRNESELRELLGRLQKALGIDKDDFATMRSTIRDLGDHSAMGALFRLVVLCLEQKALDAFKDLTAKGFNEKSKQLATLRNDVMHGDFRKVVGPAWINRFEVFATFLPVYRDFRQTVHRLTSPT